MTGFSMPSRWRGRTPDPGAYCLVCHCGDCGGLLAVCPDPGPDDFAHFDALKESGERVTRARWDTLAPPYCRCVADGVGMLSALYRLTFAVVATVVAAVVLRPIVAAHYGFWPSIAFAVGVGVLGGWAGVKWSGMGIEIGIRRRD